VNKKKQFVTCM